MLYTSTNPLEKSRFVFNKTGGEQLASGKGEGEPDIAGAVTTGPAARAVEGQAVNITGESQADLKTVEGIAAATGSPPKPPERKEELDPVKKLDLLYADPTRGVELVYKNLPPHKRAKITGALGEIAQVLKYSGLGTKKWFQGIIEGLRDDLRTGRTNFDDLFLQPGRLMGMIYSHVTGGVKAAVLFSGKIGDLKKLRDRFNEIDRIVHV